MNKEVPKAFLIQALLRDLSVEPDELSSYADQLQQRLGEIRQENTTR